MTEKISDKILNKVFSMKTMTLGLLLFLIGIGGATFIESKYGIQAAKILVYNATWFTILLAFLSLNLISNIFTHKMFRKEKIAILSFHLAFLVIILGAGVTRYLSFEGIMVIAEGETSDYIYTGDPHLLVEAKNKKSGKSQVMGNKHYLAEITHGFGNHFRDEMSFENKEISVEYINFQSKRVDSFQINKKYKNSIVLDIVTEGMKSHFIGEDDILLVGNIPLGFEKLISNNGIALRFQDGNVMFKSDYDISYTPPMYTLKNILSEKTVDSIMKGFIAMPDSLILKIPINSWTPLKTGTRYEINNSSQFVVKNILYNAKKVLMPSGNKDRASDYLTVQVSDGKSSKNVILEGGIGKIPSPKMISMNGLEYQLEYGSIRKPIPFKVTCRDFQLENYPGTKLASSYASEVTLLDPEDNKKINKRIFMNHVLDYKGYRFFQSSYLVDDPKTPKKEKESTILSVNHDYWGTNITYIGYLLMAIGMVLSIMTPFGRFRELNNKLKKLKQKNKPLKSLLLFVMLSSLGGSIYSQEHHENDGHNYSIDNNIVRGETFHVISEEHSDKLATLPVQSYRGRIIPMHTLCDELLRKTFRNNILDHKGKEYNAIQSIMSMFLYAEYWKKQNTIYIPSVLQKRLNLKKHQSYRSISHIDSNGNLVFNWKNQYEKAHQTPESDRNEFDKKIIKLLDRFQVTTEIFSGDFLRVNPIKNNPNNNWIDNNLAKSFREKKTKFYKERESRNKNIRNLSIEEKKSRDNQLTRDSLRINEMINFLYENPILQKTHDYLLSLNFPNIQKSEKLLAEIKSEQRKVAGDIIPSENLLRLEVQYNKIQIFKWSYLLYIGIGMLMLILFFIQIFVSQNTRLIKSFIIARKVLFYLLIAVFLFHGSGLIIRWLVSGHVPWSNGYEAVVFIAWVTMLAGFIFSRKNAVVIAGTAVLASLMIFVTELNLLDPEITPLQPVLKSYWLMIHVAVITGSYGFLGLACILGFLNLTLYIFRTPKTAKNISTNITELTYISEMTMTIGVFMLTIGTFLGGIWANESWGRYWGWDPKETWALVSVLVYATILHLRFIPGLKSKFVFNLVSFWGYSAILFTFFGVNFVLVGLHSYAQGDGLGDIPSWIWITALVFVGYSLLAYYRNKSYLKSKSV